MATSYADSAQAREWDRLFDDWGRPRVKRDEFVHVYEVEASAHRDEREITARKARAIRVSAAVEQYGEFFGLNGNPE